MKRTLFCIAILALPAFLSAQSLSHLQGTIVRMRMTDCVGPQHRFMAAMSGGAKVETGEQCPEYVLVGDRVVYVISGKTSDQLVPLAETTRFRLQKNEILIRVEDVSKESHFRIKAMVLRPEWDRNQMIEEAAATAMISRTLNTGDIREEQ
jgi:hypothetical protein